MTIKENEAASIEAKINNTLLLMKQELENEEGPKFKRFWELRKECLVLFKENLDSALRAKLWESYLSLADEARMVKEHVEGNSKFASEQLDLAIKAVEKQVSSFIEDEKPFLTENIFIEWPKFPKALDKESIVLKRLQMRIAALTLFASKVNELRKELVKIQLRMRIKAKFFERLSKLGDLIFPLRKELIEEISKGFMRVVEQFASMHFSNDGFDPEKMKRSLFFFREEIKELQLFGKLFALNSAAFTSTRMSLSMCWDQLKSMEKELRKEFSEQKVTSADNVKLVYQRIEAAKALDVEQLANELFSIQKYMKEVELVRSDVVMLKEAIEILREPLRAQERQQQEEMAAKLAEEGRLKNLLYEEFKEKIAHISVLIEEGEIGALQAELVLYKQQVQGLTIPKLQKQQLTKELTLVHEKIMTLKESRLLALSPEDKNALALFLVALEENYALRKEIKEEIEKLRKKKGSCSLNFQQALHAEDLLDNAKERLVKVEQLIEDLEEKKSNIN